MNERLDAVDELGDVLRALANDERRSLLSALRQLGHNGAATIGELATWTELTRFSASHHLAVLREAGLVSVTSIGTRRVHALRTDALFVLEDWLLAFVDDLYREAG